MTLLITILAACITTIIWYKNAPSDDMKLGTLALVYWGAALMWMVDAIYEYKELGAAFFEPALADMLNDSFLGFSVVALGLVMWLVVLLVKDPRGVLKEVVWKMHSHSK